MNILIALFSFVLIILCLFTLMVVMVQKPKGDGGMGAALGGGSMEAALGAETGSLLTKITIYAVIGFFVLTFALYLGNLASKKSVEAESNESLLSEIVDETAAEDSGTSGLTTDSTLQQVIQATETETAPAEEVVTELPEEAAASGQAGTEAAEEAAKAAEKTTNP